MAIKTKAELKELFETGDVITQASLEDLIDSQAGLDAQGKISEAELPSNMGLIAKAAVGLEAGQLTGPTATFVRNANGSTKDSIYGDIPDEWKKVDQQPDLTILSLGSSVTSIGNYAFGSGGYYGVGSNLSGDLTIPNSVTSIGSYAFYGCNGFEGSLTIGNSVTTIGSSAFRYCSGFTGSLTIGNSVTSIGSYAFAYCENFTGNLTIPNSVTTIGIYAFRYCSGFDGSLTLPTNPLFTTIGSYAFAYCENFTGNLTIPNSVTTNGDYAFYTCTNLTNVDCYVTRTIMNATGCLLNSGVTTINVPTSGAVADTWTVGADTIGGKAVTVSKTL